GTIKNVGFDKHLHFAKGLLVHTQDTHDAPCKFVHFRDIVDLSQDAIVVRSLSDLHSFFEIGTQKPVCPYLQKLYNQNGKFMGTLTEITLQKSKVCEIAVDKKNYDLSLVHSVSDSGVCINDSGKKMIVRGKTSGLNHRIKLSALPKVKITSPKIVPLDTPPRNELPKDTNNLATTNPIQADTPSTPRLHTLPYPTTPKPSISTTETKTSPNTHPVNNSTPSVTLPTQPTPRQPIPTTPLDTTPISTPPTQSTTDTSISHLLGTQNTSHKFVISPQKSITPSPLSQPIQNTLLQKPVPPKNQTTPTPSQKNDKAAVPRLHNNPLLPSVSPAKIVNTTMLAPQKKQEPQDKLKTITPNTTIPNALLGTTQKSPMPRPTELHNTAVFPTQIDSDHTEVTRTPPQGLSYDKYYFIKDKLLTSDIYDNLGKKILDKGTLITESVIVLAKKCNRLVHLVIYS
ncbi:MAG: hypothetical protein FWD76_02830, partial [Firmicutes bacterium]|nr:hypothetical protein [Bacillota bacterium]